MADRAKLRKLLEGILARHGDKALFSDQDSLLNSGRMDSINILEIIAKLDSDFGFSLPEELFDKNSFDSLESIAKLLESQGH